MAVQAVCLYSKGRSWVNGEGGRIDSVSVNHYGNEVTETCTILIIDICARTARLRLQRMKHDSPNIKPPHNPPMVAPMARASLILSSPEEADGRMMKMCSSLITCICIPFRPCVSVLFVGGVELGDGRTLDESIGSYSYAR